MKNRGTFKAAANAKRALKKSSSQNVLSEEQVEELRLAFDMFDSDNKGHLTKADVAGLLEKFGVRGDAAAMFKEADATNSGKVGFPEFTSMMARKMKMVDTEDDLMEAFRVFDPYGEGNIDANELRTALTTMGDKLTKEELDEMFSVCLVDGNVNYKSFTQQVFASK